MNIKGKTIGEIYGPAMEITDPAEARAYFDALVEMAGGNPDIQGKSNPEAVNIVKSNLGYYAGYYGQGDSGACRAVI